MDNTKPVPKATPRVPVKVEPATPEQMDEIAHLASELGMDPKKDIYDPMKITAPSSAQAVAIIKRLSDKLSKAIDEAASQS